MPYKRFSFKIIFRIALLVTNVLILAAIFGDMRLFFNQIILGLILVVQVIELIHFVNHTNRELARFFAAVRHSDFSITFKDASLGKSFGELQESFNELIDAFKEVKIEKEIQFQFLQKLVRQINIGIISLEGDEVVLSNPTADKLLGINALKHWKAIRENNPLLAAEIEQLRPQGRKLLEINATGEQKMVMVEVSTLLVLDKPHVLITVQDINSEIEQKEIEAWHKLIRILTHEIMNSVTPIASLTETMQSMLTDAAGIQKSSQQLADETISDIRFSLNTIQNRSEGLLTFIDSYRTLSRVPKPVIGKINVRDFLASNEALMRHELQQHAIQLLIKTEGGDLYFQADQKLIEQVMINLITNSMHALEDCDKKVITLSGFASDSHVLIEVTDTGKGIPEKELKEIFVPFFSTKKTGSGIGLSLSKQIMSLHGGRIKVSSVVNEGTTFQLSFRRIK